MSIYHFHHTTKTRIQRKDCIWLDIQAVSLCSILQLIAFACHKKIELEPLRYALMWVSLFKKEIKETFIKKIN